MGRYVIVGNGVAGTKAAEELRLRRPDADIVVRHRGAVSILSSPSVGRLRFRSDRGGPVVGQARHVLLRTAHRSAPLGAGRVRSMPAAGTVTLAGGETLGYDGLLVATGRHATAGGVKGDGGAGVNHFKTLADAQAVRAITRDGKTGVVYGNGLASLEMVRALTAGGFATTYVVPTERLWPDVLDDEAAGIIASRVRAAGAELVLGVTAEAVGGSEGGATGATPRRRPDAARRCCRRLRGVLSGRRVACPTAARVSRWTKRSPRLGRASGGPVT